MRFLSVCSGIEAASVAWSPLGWKAWAFSEIEKFPSSVLAHHYPDTPNLGDMNGFKDWPDADISLLCGGTPCQSFSNAGLRAGLDDPRGQLMLTFGAIAAKYRPRWLVWENVPGVLSSSGGRDFGAFLGLLGFLGYGFAYRVLDAQFVRVDGHGRAVPQRRNRVFVVGCLGDWRSAAAVLLERESLRGDLAPSRRAGPGAAAGPIGCASVSSGRGWWDESEVGATIRAQDSVTKADTLVSMCLTAHGGGRYDAESETLIPTNGGAFDGAHAFDARQSDVVQYGNIAGPLDTDAFSQAIAFGVDCFNGTITGDIAATMGTRGSSETASGPLVMPASSMRVRRLTPTECERLMGFPDGYTAVPWRGKPAADGPRYKALGNSWATNCARWVGRRIALVDSIERTLT